METIQKIGLGGSCHWCTEAIFQQLKGVVKVAQGYIASLDENDSFSEAVIVTYTSKVIELKDLIEIHLHTHNSTSNHSFREKYRSAIYYFEENQKLSIEFILKELQKNFDATLITTILKFKEFKPSRNELLNYYAKNPEKPFCKKYINPKLEFLRDNYSNSIN